MSDMKSSMGHHTDHVTTAGNNGENEDKEESWEDFDPMESTSSASTRLKDSNTNNAHISENQPTTTTTTTTSKPTTPTTETTTTAAASSTSLTTSTDTATNSKQGKGLSLGGKNKKVDSTDASKKPTAPTTALQSQSQATTTTATATTSNNTDATKHNVEPPVTSKSPTKVKAQDINVQNKEDEKTGESELDFFAEMEPDVKKRNSGSKQSTSTSIVTSPPKALLTKSQEQQLQPQQQQQQQRLSGTSRFAMTQLDLEEDEAGAHAWTDDVDIDVEIEVDDIVDEKIQNENASQRNTILAAAITPVSTTIAANKTLTVTLTSMTTPTATNFSTIEATSEKSETNISNKPILSHSESHVDSEDRDSASTATSQRTMQEKDIVSDHDDHTGNNDNDVWDGDDWEIGDVNDEDNEPLNKRNTQLDLTLQAITPSTSSKTLPTTTNTIASTNQATIANPVIMHPQPSDTNTRHKQHTSASISSILSEVHQHLEESEDGWVVDQLDDEEEGKEEKPLKEDDVSASVTNSTGAKEEARDLKNDWDDWGDD